MLRRRGCDVWWWRVPPRELRLSASETQGIGMEQKKGENLIPNHLGASTATIPSPKADGIKPPPLRGFPFYSMPLIYNILLDKTNAVGDWNMVGRGKSGVGKYTGIDSLGFTSVTNRQGCDTTGEPRCTALPATGSNERNGLEPILVFNEQSTGE
jgi:hypothetical protein